MPDSAILVEPKAANTGQNVSLSRALLAAHGCEPRSVLLISKPYMERRAYATCRKVWPEVEVVCASEPLKLDDYVRSIGDEKLVIDMLVEDLQRVVEYPKLGFAVEQDVPAEVLAACDRLIDAGFDSRLLLNSGNDATRTTRRAHACDRREAAMTRPTPVQPCTTQGETTHGTGPWNR